MKTPWRARVSATLIRFSTWSAEGMDTTPRCLAHYNYKSLHSDRGNEMSKASNRKEAHLTSPAVQLLQLMGRTFRRKGHQRSRHKKKTNMWLLRRNLKTIWNKNESNAVDDRFCNAMVDSNWTLDHKIEYRLDWVWGRLRTQVAQGWLTHYKLYETTWVVRTEGKDNKKTYK